MSELLVSKIEVRNALKIVGSRSNDAINHIPQDKPKAPRPDGARPV